MPARCFLPLQRNSWGWVSGEAKIDNRSLQGHVHPWASRLPHAMLIADDMQKVCEKWEQQKCINGDWVTLDLTVLHDDSCVDLLPLTLSVVSLSLHYLANCPLPLAPRTPNLQMHK